MKVLVVEDTPERQRLLERLFAGLELTVVPTAEQAIALLRVVAFDLVFLDYDLASEMTGADVAGVLGEIDPPPTVVIQSVNPDGVDAIQRMLPSAYSLPITRLEPRSELYSLIRGQLARGELVNWKLMTSGS